MRSEKKYGRRLPFGIVFLGGVLIYLLAVLPFLIKYRGLFFYYGDYNVQQVPFLILAHRAVRQGRFFWNPMVDLGGNMGGMFAFYLWGSPFFWLTIPFPESWLPYMMPYLMALKSGTAAAAAFAWIRTHTKSDRAAAMGGLLYAFSGFQACNIVFQHFHDATAFFPLYLLAFDRFLETGGRERGKLAAFAEEKTGAGGICGRKTAGDHFGTFADRYGFLLMTAWMSVINYYFFFGQVIFLALYYFVRRGVRLVRTTGIRTLAADLLRILAAGTAGLMLVSFFLVQSVGGILGNTRVGKVLSGYDLIVYPDSTTPLAILRSFFSVPDLVARGTLFTSDHIRNGSLAFYLPCFAMTGVFAFWILRRCSWKKTLLKILAVMAFVPVLCASFSAFNSNFYVRWFYMPILLCAGMTAEVLEEPESAAFTKGAVLSLLFTALFILCAYLPVQEDGKWSFTSICENRKLLTTEIRATLFGAALLAVIVFIKRRKGALFADGPEETLSRKEETLSREEETLSRADDTLSRKEETLSRADDTLSRKEETLSPEEETLSREKETRSRREEIRKRIPSAVCILLTVIGCIASTQAVLHNGSSLIAYTGFEKWKKQMLGESPLAGIAEDPVSGEGNPFFRVETDSTSTNYEMVWGIPTMHCFESTVHPSVFRWYRGIGMIRTVESTLPAERIGARAVMSVRYNLDNTLVRKSKKDDDEEALQGYSLCAQKGGYDIYETENYIPMGFAFDRYMTEETYDRIENGSISDRVLVRDIILSDEMAEKYGDLLEEDTEPDRREMPYWEFAQNCRDRAETACTAFAFDQNGFHARAAMEKGSLLLFSIPYDSGFTATIDGEQVQVERADFGLTAIYVPEGEHEIRASYLPPGFKACAVLSLLTAAGLVLHALFWNRIVKAAATLKDRGSEKEPGEEPEKGSGEKRETK